MCDEDDLDCIAELAWERTDPRCPGVERECSGVDSKSSREWAEPKLKCGADINPE
jgi:hypothetical protein